jgi:hypothetical protein
MNCELAIHFGLSTRVVIHKTRRQHIRWVSKWWCTRSMTPELQQDWRGVRTISKRVGVSDRRAQRHGLTIEM